MFTVHISELKVTFYVPALTPNFVWIMDGNFSDCVTGFEEYGLCEGVPVSGRGIELDDL